jgi:hypothetical protein
MEFDLNMKSSKLQVINLQEGESELFYGDLVASIRSLDITGPFKDISIDIRGAEPVEKSHVYLPLSSNSGTGTYSYVTFKNYGKPQQVKRKSKNKLSVHIETIMKELAEISLVLDPATGDAINAKGTGRLTIDIPSGNEMRMNGKYTVAEGDYTFTLKDLFFKRNFKLDEGSVIFFNGPIEKTLLDVQGIYSARARLYDLLSNAEKKAFESLGSVKEKNETKAQQTVNVRLFMKGSMGSPQLKFKLEIPDKSSMGTTAYNKLQTINQDDYKLNNQVASLLLFGNFISDDGNITDNAGSGSLSSVSQVFSGQVSSQLSNAVSKLTGDESLRIDVNYNNYNLTNTESSLGTNNRSEVSLGVKKNLFRNSLNDRLVLEVGSKYDWGKASSTSNSSNFNPVGDFRLQYQFREQGTLRGYLFRTSSYDVIGDRNVSRGGIGLSWSRSFNYLGDFFRSQKYINRKRLEEEEKIKADENESGTR